MIDRSRLNVAYWPEEANGIIGLISGWLELDALDSWVRHDSEIVSIPFSCASIYEAPSSPLALITFLGFAAGAISRIIFRRTDSNPPTPQQSQSDSGLWACHQRMSRTYPIHAVFYQTSDIRPIHLPSFYSA